MYYFGGAVEPCSFCPLAYQYRRGEEVAMLPYIPSTRGTFRGFPNLLFGVFLSGVHVLLRALALDARFDVYFGGPPPGAARGTGAFDARPLLATRHQI